MRQWNHVVVVALAALAIAARAAGQAPGPNVDDLLSKYFAARGGLDKLKGMTTLRMTGRIDASGQQIAMTMVSKRPNLMRQEMQLPATQLGAGQTIVSAFDGARMWAINPMTGSSAPQVVPGPQAQIMKDQADFDGPLVDYQAKGNTVEYVGVGTVEGRKTHKLKVTTKAKATVTLELDAETSLEVRLTREIDMGGVTGRVETLMSDFRAVSGLMMPHSVRNLFNGQPQAVMTIDKIEINVPVDGAVFMMPQK